MNLWWIALVVALIAAGAGFFLYRRYSDAQGSSGRDDRYTPERILTPEQTQMLDYLSDTFPDQVVLPNLALKDMLSIRRASNRKRAQERLDRQRVDFVVCDLEGRPVFAFDMEQYHLSNAKERAHMSKVKNRILKTAGVRFVLLKNGIHRMPSPSDFRAQLNLAALPQPKLKQDEQQGDSVRQKLESRFSEFDQLHGNSRFRESEVMGLSGLMDLDKDIDRDFDRRQANVQPLEKALRR